MRWSLGCDALCLLPSAAALVAASLLAAGIVTGVVRVGVGSADAGVFHGPVLYTVQ